MKPARKASSSISGELTLTVVLPHKKIKYIVQDVKRNMRIHIYRDGGGKQVLFSIALNQTEPGTLSRRNMMNQSSTTVGTPGCCYFGDLSQTLLCTPRTH